MKKNIHCFIVTLIYSQCYDGIDSSRLQPFLCRSCTLKEFRVSCHKSEHMKWNEHTDPVQMIVLSVAKFSCFQINCKECND